MKNPFKKGDIVWLKRTRLIENYGVVVGFNKNYPDYVRIARISRWTGNLWFSEYHFSQLKKVTEPELIQDTLEKFRRAGLKV